MGRPGVEQRVEPIKSRVNIWHVSSTLNPKEQLNPKRTTYLSGLPNSPCLHVIVVEQEHMVFIFMRGCIVITGTISICNVWRTTWLLLCLNLKHVCGLQFSVQSPQGGQLTCEWVDNDGTVLVQYRIPEQRETEQWWINETCISRNMCVWNMSQCSIPDTLTGSVGVSGYNCPKVVHKSFLRHSKSVNRLGKHWWLIDVQDRDLYLSINQFVV